MRQSLLVEALVLFLAPIALAHAQGSPQPQEKAAILGQISGHVYRAETGAPLAGALVILEPIAQGSDASQRAGADGSFQFANVAPGPYWIAADLTGFVFVGLTTREDKPLAHNPPCHPFCLAVGPGQKLGAIDLRLKASPNITTMSDGLIVATYPEQDRNNLYFHAQARFSPDGEFLVVITTGPVGGDAEQVWLYNIRSRQIVAVVTDRPQDIAAHHTRGIGDVAWGADDTLYVSGNNRIGQPFVKSTMAGATEITVLPDPILAAFKRQAVSQMHDMGRDQRVNQYVITVERREPHGSIILSMRLSDETGAQDIAEGSWELESFLVDSNRSLLFYPKAAPFNMGAIVIFDLNTRRSQDIALPVNAEELLDLTQDGTGYRVAYVTSGPCEPRASSERAEMRRLVPGLDTAIFRRKTHVGHVCFAKIP
jgi:hypothetical protein